MKKERRKREKKIHLVPLIVGIYIVFLGFGLVRIGIFDFIDSGVPIRFLLGLVMTGIGLFGIWDGVRDLLDSRKKQKEQTEAPASQYVFINVEGWRSSNVSPQQLQEQLKIVEEKGGARNISLSMLPPFPVPGKGNLARVFCISGAYELPLCLAAVFQLDNGEEQTLMKEMETEQAQAFLEWVLNGDPGDFSGWRSAELKWESKNMPVHKRLTLIGEHYRNDYEFFSGRDLELAIEGLGEGDYLRVELVVGELFLYALRSQEEEACITLHLSIAPEGSRREFEKTGTVTQAKFWLIQMINNGLKLYDWQEVTGQKK